MPTPPAGTDTVPQPPPHPARVHELVPASRRPGDEPRGSARPLRGRAAELDDVLATLSRPAQGASAVHVVVGPSGYGRTFLLRAALAELAVTRVLWVDGRGPPEVDRRRGLPGLPVHELAGRPVAGALTTVVVDDLHELDPAEVAALSAWLRGVRHPFALVVASRTLGAGTPGAEMIAEFPDVRYTHLDALGVADAGAIISDHLGGAPPDSVREQVVRVSQGIPALAGEIGLQLRADPPELRYSRGTVDDVCMRAVQAVCLRRLHRDRPSSIPVAVLTALIAPEGSVAVATTLLDLAPQGVDRRERELRELGLLPEDPLARRAVRAAALAWSNEPVHGQAAVALGYLERLQAPPLRLLETLQLMGVRDQRYVDAAARAVAVAAAEGSVDDVRRVAGSVLVLGICEPSVAWARGVLLQLSMTRNWHEAATTVLGAGVDSGGHALLGPDVPVEFGLESPAAAARLALERPADGDPRTTAQRLLAAGAPVPPGVLRAALRASGSCPDPLDASLLAVLALRGLPAEARADRLRARLGRTSGERATGSSFAVWFAVGELALADYTAAWDWSSLAVLTSSARGQEPCLAMAHLVAAQAALRLGRHDDARQHADEAGRQFSAFGAVRLAAVSLATRLHADLEDGRPVEWPGLPDPARMHPLLGAYLTYVQARVRLSAGDLPGASAGLFETGRRLGAAGLDNPTLLNWRPHLAGLFRAVGQERVANSIDEDLVQAMLIWSRRNPQAARRRVVILGRRQSVLDEPVDPPPPSATDLGPVEGRLSRAEVRVARLIASGRSNSEVARELVLSKRTIDTHLTHIYTKLDVHSRNDFVDLCGPPSDRPGAEPSLQERLVYG